MSKDNLPDLESTLGGLIVSTHGKEQSIFVKMMELYHAEEELRKKEEKRLRKNPVSGHVSLRDKDEDAERIKERAERSTTPEKAYILLLDTTDFKPTNDYIGHFLGNEAIRTIVKTIDETVRGSLRAYDLVDIERDSPVYHISGDEKEVIILAPNDVIAYDIAVRIKKTVDNIEWPAEIKEKLDQYSIRIRESVGVTEWKVREEALSEAEMRAERYTTMAKALGDDDVVGLQYVPEMNDDDLRKGAAMRQIKRHAHNAGLTVVANDDGTYHLLPKSPTS
jgi:diguanylate cyclase (GGDEF)-like protein